MSLDIQSLTTEGANPEEQLPTLDVAPGWAVAQLSVLADVALGKTPGKADYDDKGALKIVKYRDLNDDGFIDWDKSNKGFVKPERAEVLNLRPLFASDVLVSASAHSSEIIGRKVLLVTQIPERFQQVFVCGEILCIRCERAHVEPLPGFLRYFLQSAWGYKSIQAKVHGVHLIASRAEEIHVLVAPANEQRRIVSKIDELFSRIDEGEQALRRVEKLVERYRQSMLKAAVTGELTRDWRAARKRAGEPVESGAALLARILKARRAAWEIAELAKLKAKGKPPTDERWKQKYQEPASPDTTDLPALPEGWIWASPVQLESDDAHALTIGPFGSDLKVSDYAASGVPLVFVRNIRSASFQGNGTKYVSAEKAAALCAHKVRAGDILITKMGDPPGDACVYPAGAPDAIVTADCIKWTLHPLLSSPLFVCTFVVSRFGKAQIRDITTGVAQQKVSLSRFRRLAIPVPGLQEQDAVNDRVMRVAQQVRLIEAEINDGLMHAKALRQSILKAAFSGQLVPQNPNDEPASKLLERIAAERAATPTVRQRRKKSA